MIDVFRGKIGEAVKVLLAYDATTAAVFNEDTVEKIIRILLFKDDPLMSVIALKKADADTVKWKAFNSLPEARVEGEGATTPITQAGSANDSVDLKIIRTKGSILGFTAATTRKTLDLLKMDLKIRIMALRQALSAYTQFGDATADVFQWDGLDSKVQTNRFDHAGLVDTDLLDKMIDSIPATFAAKLMFCMSNPLISAISKQDSTVRKSLAKVEFAGGRRMQHYRNIPIMPSSMTRPVTTFGAITFSDKGAGGALDTAATYQYRVAAVTVDGEQFAVASTPMVLGGGENEVKVNWTAVTGAIIYKIYRTVGGGAAGTEKLLVRVPAKAYTAGTISGNITSYIDLLADSVLHATDKPLESAAGIDPDSHDEIVQLVNLDADYGMAIQGCRGTNGRQLDDLVELLELALTGDSKDYIMQAFCAASIYNEALMAIARRARAKA